MEFNVKPITLSFNNLHVSIANRKILDSVGGCVKPGEVLAIMGPSGSGKTTLLNFLAGREVGDSKYGEVLLNGNRLNKKFKRKIRYVLQHDLFFDNLTLKETLTYSAMLRLPDKMPKMDKLKKIDEIMAILDVKKCADTQMGGALKRGLSGGEKKRASIGCELITNPSILFLDEPTSGLDSSNAYNLIKTVQALAENERKTIVMSIHQPSSQIFHLFDKLLLLVNGKVAYYGKSSEVVHFFEKAGFHCEEHYNPADYILDVLSRGTEVEEKIVSACQEWLKGTVGKRDNNSDVLPQNTDSFREDHESGSLNSSLGTHKWNTLHTEIMVDEDENAGCRSLDGNINKAYDASDDGDDEEKDEGNHWDHGNRWPTSFWTQLCVLSQRTFKQSKPVILSKLNLAQNFFVAIIVGLIWFQVPHEEESIEDRRGLLFFYIMYWSLTPLFQALLVFPAEEEVIRKERSAGQYRLSAYYFGKCLSEIPLVVCHPLMFLCVFYWMCGLNPSVAFLGQALNLIITSILSQSIGLAIGATVMSLERGIVVAVVSMLAVMLVGGFYTKRIPFWLKWSRYLSVIYYSYENSQIMEFTGIKGQSCAEKTSYIACKNNATVLTGTDILKHYGVKRSFGENFAILCAFIIAFRAIGYFSLRLLHKPK